MIEYTPAMIISYHEFIKRIKGNLKEFSDELEECRIELKRISRFPWDNNIARFSYCNSKEFSFMLVERNNWDVKTQRSEGTGEFKLVIWNDLGNNHIYEHLITKEEERNNFIQDLSQSIEKWTLGEIMCSDCKKWISYKGNGHHRYFAGIYCDDCWNRSWKEIASNESYN